MDDYAKRGGLPTSELFIVILCDPKAWFPLDRNAIVESYDSSMFWLTAKRLMGIYDNTFFFHKLEPIWVRLMPKMLTKTFVVSQNLF